MHYGKCAYRTTSSSGGTAPVTAHLALDKHRGGGSADSLASSQVRETGRAGNLRENSTNRAERTAQAAPAAPERAVRARNLKGVRGDAAPIHAHLAQPGLFVPCGAGLASASHHAAPFTTGHRLGARHAQTSLLLVPEGRSGQRRIPSHQPSACHLGALAHWVLGMARLAEMRAARTLPARNDSNPFRSAVPVVVAPPFAPEGLRACALRLHTHLMGRSVRHG